MDRDSLAGRTCNFCGSVFSRRDNMRVHQTTTKKCLQIQNQLRQGVDAATGAPIQMFPRVVGYPAHAISNDLPPPLIPLHPIDHATPHPMQFPNRPDRPLRIPLKQIVSPTVQSSNQTFAASNAFQCEQCYEVLASRAALKHHIQTHHFTKLINSSPAAAVPIPGDGCSSTSTAVVQSHRDRTALGAVAFKGMPDPAEQVLEAKVTAAAESPLVIVYKCPICMENFDTGIKFRRHMRTAKNHPRKPFHFCQYCKVKDTLIFDNAYHLCCHLLTNHPDAPEIPLLEQQLPPREQSNLQRQHAVVEPLQQQQHPMENVNRSRSDHVYSIATADADLPPPDLVFAPLKEIENQFGLYPIRCCQLVRENWQNIRTQYNFLSPMIKELQIRFNQPVLDPGQVLSDLLHRIHVTQKTAYRIQLMLGHILRNKITGEVEHFPASNCSDLLCDFKKYEDPKYPLDKFERVLHTITATTDLEQLIRQLRGADIYEILKQNRRNSEWEVLCLTGVLIRIFPIPFAILGCVEGDIELPEYLRQKRSILGFIRSPHGHRYKDNKCFLRCLVQADPEKPNWTDGFAFEESVDELIEDYCTTFGLDPSLFNGVNLNTEVALWEQFLKVRIQLYEVRPVEEIRTWLQQGPENLHVMEKKAGVTRQRRQRKVLENARRREGATMGDGEGCRTSREATTRNRFIADMADESNDSDADDESRITEDEDWNWEEQNDPESLAANNDDDNEGELIESGDIVDAAEQSFSAVPATVCFPKQQIVPLDELNGPQPKKPSPPSDGGGGGDSTTACGSSSVAVGEQVELLAEPTLHMDPAEAQTASTEYLRSPAYEPVSYNGEIQQQRYYTHVVRKSPVKYERTVNILLVNQIHCALIVNLHALSHSYQCSKCLRLFGALSNCRKHERLCDGNGQIRHVYPGAAYLPFKTIFERLELCGYKVHHDLPRFYPYLCTLDFECFNTVTAQHLLGPTETSIAETLEPYPANELLNSVEHLKLKERYPMQFANFNKIRTFTNGHNYFRIRVVPDGHPSTAELQTIAQIVLYRQQLASEVLVNLHCVDPDEQSYAELRLCDEKLSLTKYEEVPQLLQYFTMEKVLDILPRTETGTPWTFVAISFQVKQTRLTRTADMVACCAGLTSNVPHENPTFGGHCKDIITLFVENEGPEAQRKLIRDVLERLNSIAEVAKSEMRDKFAQLIAQLQADCSGVKGLQSEVQSQMVKYKSLKVQYEKELKNGILATTAQQETALNRLLDVAEQISGMRAKIHHKVKIEALLDQLLAWTDTLPVFLYNGAKFDLNLVNRELLGIFVQDGVKTNIIKKTNSYIAITTHQLRICDAMLYQSAGTDLVEMINAYRFPPGYNPTAEETEASKWAKIPMPYSFMTGIECFDQSLPNIEYFDNQLKQEKCSQAIFEKAQNLYAKCGCQNFKDYLRVYQEADVKDFLTSMENYRQYMMELNLDLCRDGFTLPSLSLCHLFRNIVWPGHETTYFAVWNEREKWLKELIDANMTGGPSLIYRRFHKVGETNIKNNSAHPFKSAKGFDKTGLYLDCLMEMMPLGAPGIYTFNDQDPERPPQFEPNPGQFDLTSFPESDIELKYVTFMKWALEMFDKGENFIEPVTGGSWDPTKCSDPQPSMPGPIENHELLNDFISLLQTDVEGNEIQQDAQELPEGVNQVADGTNGMPPPPISPFTPRCEALSDVELCQSQHTTTFDRTDQDTERFSARASPAAIRPSNEPIERTPYTIMHQYFNGQKTFAFPRRSLTTYPTVLRCDGYIPNRITREGKLTPTAIELNGCFFHGCSCKFGGRNDSLNLSELNEEHRNKQILQRERYAKWIERREKLEQAGVTVIYLWTCQYYEWLKSNPWFRNHCKHTKELGCARYKNGELISQGTLLRRIEKGELYGFCLVDLMVDRGNRPLRAYFSELQPLFKNYPVGFNDLSPAMQQALQTLPETNRPFAKSQTMLCGSYSASKILLITPYLNWLARKGVTVIKVHKFIEFYGAECFQEAGSTIFSMRKEAALDDRKLALANAMKCIGNSYYCRNSKIN